MKCGFLSLAVLAASIPLLAHADPCAGAARRAEVRNGLPPDLLAAVGRVESGERAQSGQIVAWPWSINVAGLGFRLSDASDAMAMVAALRAVGARSIDVGCFQVNLMYHPDAFLSVADAFDADANAEAAARLLHGLHRAGGSWNEAIQRYHSATPALGGPYLERVLETWAGGAMNTAPAGALTRLPVVYRP